MADETQISSHELVTHEEWIVPLRISPSWVDLAIRQLSVMYQENPARFVTYQMKLYAVLLDSIRNYACDDIELCCEIAMEAETLWR